MTGLRVAQKRLIAFVIFGLLTFLLTLAIHRSFGHNIPGIDFYVSWVAGRFLLFNHISPYSAEVHQIIQNGIFGGEAPPGLDPMRFAYPPFAIIPIGPLLSLSFDWAMSCWLSINLLILIVCARYALPKIPMWMILILPLSYPFALGLSLGNFSVLIHAILLTCLASQLFNKNTSTLLQLGTGAALAWTLSKPQITWFFVGILVLHALLNKKRAFLVGLISGLAAMVLFSWIVLPGWPALWIEGMRTYQSGLPLQLPVLDYLGYIFPAAWNPVLLPFVSAVFVCLSVWLWLCWLKTKGEFETITLITWGTALLFLFNPTGRSYDQAVFFIPLLLWAENSQPMSRSARVIIPFFVLTTWLLFLLSQKLIPLAADRGTFIVFLFCAAWLLYNRHQWISKN